MADIKDWKECIVKADLTKKESEIAEFILNNISKVCFMSTSDLARELNTSSTSVNRMAKALGYKVFIDMQKELQEYVTKHTDLIDNFRLPPGQRMTKISQDDISEENLTMKYFELSSNNILSVLSKNSPDKIDRVVDILGKSRYKYINGYRGTASLAEKFGFLTGMITRNIILLTGEDISNIEKVMDIDKDDCIVIFSFNRYHKNTMDIINICKEKSAKLILITDRATAPFSQYADELLIVDVDSLSFFNSNVAPMFLIEIICTKLAAQLDNNAKERLYMLEPYINKTQIF